MTSDAQSIEHSIAHMQRDFDLAKRECLQALSAAINFDFSDAIAPLPAQQAASPEKEIMGLTQAFFKNINDAYADHTRTVRDLTATFERIANSTEARGRWVDVEAVTGQVCGSVSTVANGE